MSSRQFPTNQEQSPSLDGSGLNQNAAQMAGGSVRQQLNANTPEQRRDVRANATSLGAEQWDALDDAVMQPLREKLVLDQAFVNAGLTHDLQWWQTRSIWKIRGRMGPAQHTSDLRTPVEEDTMTEGREGIAVPYSIKGYRIYEGDLERSRQTGESLDTAHADEAARSVANLVEDTYLYGSQIQLTTTRGYQLGCPGLLNAQGRFQQPGSGTWGDGVQAKDDINEGLGILEENNYEEGPTWLVHGTDVNNFFEQDYKPSVDISRTTREKIEDLSRLDRTLYVPRMPDGEAVLMKATNSVIDAARLPDGPLNLEWTTHKELQNNYNVYHLAAPRIKHHDTGLGSNLSTGIVHIAGIGEGA